jgi:hypothetical protein
MGINVNGDTLPSGNNLITSGSQCYFGNSPCQIWALIVSEVGTGLLEVHFCTLPVTLATFGRFESDRGFPDGPLTAILLSSVNIDFDQISEISDKKWRKVP